jgi:transposase
VAGERDPAVLAELARGRLRSKIPPLREALAGRFSAHYARLVAQMLAHIDFQSAPSPSWTSSPGPPGSAGRDAGLNCFGPGRRVPGGRGLVAECGLDVDIFPSAAIWPAGPGSAPATTSRAAGDARPHAQGLDLATHRADRGDPGGQPHQRDLPGRHAQIRCSRESLGNLGRTTPSTGGNAGSNPARATRFRSPVMTRCSQVLMGFAGLEPGTCRQPDRDA